MPLTEMNNLPNFIAYISKGVSCMSLVYKAPDQLFNQNTRRMPKFSICNFVLYAHIHFLKNIFL